MVMIGAIRVKGLDKTLVKLNKEMKSIRFKTKKGLINAGFLVQRASQKIVPRDYSNLAASAFTVWGPESTIVRGAGGKSFKGPQAGAMSSDHNRIVSQEKMSLPKGDINPQVEVGFSAYYALYVHEDLNAKHKSGKEAKFLQRALERNYGRILSIVSGSVKI